MLKSEKLNDVLFYLIYDFTIMTMSKKYYNGTPGVAFDNEYAH